MKKCRKNTLKSRKGITLIALVVTIIVLLILAGISISMLSGNNGILQNATNAKGKTERQSVIEQARMDILGQQTENKGKNITKDQLKNILNKYFEDIATLELPDDLSNTDIKLNANQTYGGYQNIALVDVYNGTFSTTNAISQVPDITKNKWEIAVNNEIVGTYKFDKSGNAYFDGESEPEGTYSLDGDKLTYHFEFEWDGVKFVATVDDGSGGTSIYTLTEIIPTTFTFTIDDTEYTAEEDMTWTEWVASEYNTGNYYIENNIVHAENQIKVERGGGFAFENQLIADYDEYWTIDRSNEVSN